LECDVFAVFKESDSGRKSVVSLYIIDIYIGQFTVGALCDGDSISFSPCISSGN